MSRLLLLYPRRWRQRYGQEVSRVLADLRPASRRARFAMGVDLFRGALDAHLTTMEQLMSQPTARAIRRGVIVATIVWVALSVEIVLSNVVYPSTEDDDGGSVVIAYLVVFLSLAVIGALNARLVSGWRSLAAVGAVAGALIGVLTIGTFLVIDNLFLGIISHQQAKIDGLAHSGMSSMRAYVNTSLLTGMAVLTIFLAAIGAGLATLGGLVRRGPSGRQSDSA